MKKMFLIVPLFLLAGCFTLKQTEVPNVQLTQAPAGRDIKVSCTGFAATITTYVPVYGYQTAYVSHGPYYHHGRRGWYGGGHYETTTSQTLIPQVQASQAYLTRAQNLLEDAGYLLWKKASLNGLQPDYTVEVTFDGPFVRGDEQAVEFAWMFLSVFSAEYSTQTWTAKLRVYDAKSGRVLLTKDYSQKYETNVFGLIPLFSIASCDETSSNALQIWCLSALTDRALADATAFLAGRAERQAKAE